MLANNRDLFVYGCDFSNRAIEFVKLDPRYDPIRCHAFICDITQDSLSQSVENVDLVSALFVLSALPPFKMPLALSNVASVMKKGSIFLFRDYAQYDLAQLRFKNESKIEDSLYVRCDGTFSHFMTKEYVQEIFESHNFKIIELDYVVKSIENRKRELRMNRIFIQGRFEKL